MIKSIEEQLIEDEWLEHEIKLFLNCTEEVNPDLPEDLALKRMSFIISEVEKRLGRPSRLKRRLS